MSESKIGFWSKLIGRIILGRNRKVFFSLSLDLLLTIREQGCFFLVMTCPFDIKIEPSISEVDLFNSSILPKSFQIEDFVPVISSALREFSTPRINFLPVFKSTVQFQEELIDLRTECRELRIDKTMLSIEAIGSLPLEKFQRPQIYSFLSRMVVAIKECSFLLSRLRVIKRPLLSSFLSKEEQLIFWKLAVRRSGKTVKSLTFGAVFYGVPVAFVENISYDPRRHLLFYTLRADPLPGLIRTKKVAAFIDNENQKVFFVNYD